MIRIIWGFLNQKVTDDFRKVSWKSPIRYPAISKDRMEEVSVSDVHQAVHSEFPVMV